MRVRRIVHWLRLPSLFGAGVVAATVAAASIAAHAHGDHHHGAVRTSKATPEELAAFARVKPIFAQHCFRCHTSFGKKSRRKALDHLSMDHYPFTGPHASEAGQVVRKVLGADGKEKATMPSDDPGAVPGDDLAKVVAWADVFDRAHPVTDAGVTKTTTKAKATTENKDAH